MRGDPLKLSYALINHPYFYSKPLSIKRLLFVYSSSGSFPPLDLICHPNHLSLRS